MQKRKHTANFQLEQPVGMVFPLFSAEGERHWVPGWDYENVMGSTELHEDYIFITKNHDHASTDAIWLTKRYEPESYLVQFYKVEPEDKIGVISVQCNVIAESRTQVEVSYEYMGLSEKGNEFIEGFSSADYREFINEWHELLVRYFESKG